MDDQEKINDSHVNEMAPPQTPLPTADRETEPQVSPPERDGEEKTQLLLKNADPEVQSASDVREESGPEKYMPLPPDGGYGWVIVAVSFLGNALVDGLCSTFCVFLPYFLASFPGASVAKTALAGSLMPCLFMTAGPVASALMNCYGCRVVTIAGGIVTCVGLILATYSPNVNVLIVTYGGISGIGMALMYLPSMVMVGCYFEKRRPLAAGIASSGSGFGMLILAPLAAYLVSEYHWKGALVILSGVMLQGVVLGSLMRPLETPNTTVSQSVSELTDEELLLADAPDQSEARTGKHKPVNEIKANGAANCDKETHAVKADESVQLYRKALQNSFLNKLPVSASINSGSLYESQQDLGSRRRQGSDAGLYSGLGYCLSDGNSKTQNGSDSRKKMCSTQSCYELPVHTTTTPEPPGGNHRERTNTVSAHRLELPSEISRKQPSRAGTAMAQSCHEIYTQSYRPDSPTHAQREPDVKTNRDRLIQELVKPLHRQDIFYGGSIASLPQYKSQPDLKSYIASVTVIPQVTSLPEEDRLCQRIPQDTLQWLKNCLDLAILANPYFVVICTASVIIQIGYFIPIVYIVDYAISLGSSTQEGAVIISVIGISNTLGRSVGGCLANLSWVNYLHLNNVTLLVAGCATLLVGTLVTSFPTLVTYAVVLGFCLGPYASLSTIFLVDYLGMERLTNSFGLLSMVKGLSTIAGAPIAGVLLDASRSYALTFYFAGSMFVGAALVFYLLPCVTCCTTRRREGRIDETTQ